MKEKESDGLRHPMVVSQLLLDTAAKHTESFAFLRALLDEIKSDAKNN